MTMSQIENQWLVVSNLHGEKNGAEVGGVGFIGSCCNVM